jgi:hypothetical protein
MNPETEYSEALLSLRHYSNLRFAEMSLFSATTGALAALAYAHSSRGPIPLYVILLGCCVSVVFIGLELSVRAYIRAFRRYILQRWPDTHFAAIPRWARDVPPLLFLTLYGGVLALWIALPFLPLPLR